MFEHCDPNARLVIEVALDEARDRYHNWLGTEHLLVAFARRRDLLPDDVARLLPEADALGSALAARLGTGLPEPELLKAVGVDLDEVRSALRRTFGNELVERLRTRVDPSWQPWRRHCTQRKAILSEELSVMPRAKQSLERSRRIVERRDPPLIDPAAMLLGMVQVRDAMSNRLLRQLGVEPERLGGILRRHTG